MTTAWQPTHHRGGGPLRMELGDLAERLGGRLIGEPTRLVDGILPLDQATDRHLSFVHAAAYLRRATASAAAAFLVPESLDAQVVTGALADRSRIVVASSQLAVAQALEVFFHLPRPAAGVHETAVLGDGCELGDEVSIGPYAVVGDGCRLGDHVVVEAHAVLGRGCLVGAGSWLHAGAVLYDGCVLGERVRVHSGAVVGGHGFGYATVAGVHHKIPQVGRTVLGNDVEVGVNAAVDRALADETRIGPGTKIDNLVQVGHNVQTGRGCILCGQAGVAGTAKLGDYVVLSGQVGVADHLELGDGVQVAAGSKVLRSVEAGRVVGGSTQVLDIKDWRRVSSSSVRLPELLRRVARLERRLAEQAGPPGDDQD